MSTRVTPVDKQRFGPWAVITGASSGIGRAFAAQLAASGINLVLAARRLSILDEVGRDLARQHSIQYRSVRVDLAEPDFLNTIIDATNDLPGATATAMTARFGADKTAMGRLMMSADACATGGLAVLAANRAVRISGRMNRATVALTPRRTRIRMFGAMNRSMADTLTTTSAPSTPGVELDDRPV